MFASLNGQHPLWAAVGLHALQPQHNLLCGFSLRHKEGKIITSIQSIFIKTFVSHNVVLDSTKMLWGSFMESLKLYVHLKCTLGSVYLWSDQKWWNRSLLHMQLERTSSDQRSWLHYKCDVQNERDNFYEPHLYLVVLFTCNRIARNWCYNAKKLRLNIHPNSNTEIFSKMPNKNIKPCQKKIHILLTLTLRHF